MRAQEERNRLGRVRAARQRLGPRGQHARVGGTVGHRGVRVRRIAPCRRGRSGRRPSAPGSAGRDPFPLPLPTAGRSVRACSSTSIACRCAQRQAARCGRPAPDTGRRARTRGPPRNAGQSRSPSRARPASAAPRAPRRDGRGSSRAVKGSTGDRALPDTAHAGSDTRASTRRPRAAASPERLRNCCPSASASHISSTRDDLVGQHRGHRPGREVLAGHARTLEQPQLGFARVAAAGSPASA